MWTYKDMDKGNISRIMAAEIRFLISIGEKTRRKRLRNEKFERIHTPEYKLINRSVKQYGHV
jgi:hypothetical protein